MKNRQRAMNLPIRILDNDGRPISGAQIEPWALRDAQAQILWRSGEQPSCNITPETAQTDSDGAANIMYPYFCDAREENRTTSVSISIDHPEYVRIPCHDVKVPLEGSSTYSVKLERGTQIDVRAFIDGEQIDTQDLYVYGTSGEWAVRASKENQTDDGALRISTMPLGEDAFWITRIVDGVATHFSKVIEIPVKAGSPSKIDAPLFPSRRISGRLSNNVPRPIKSGCVIANSHGISNSIDWYCECAVQPDGTFTINGWPQGEPMQVIALSDDYMARPDIAAHFDRECESRRPQIIRARDEFELAMVPLVRCVVTTVDAQGKPISGVHVLCFPNAQWFNGGAQVYCGDDEDVPPLPFHGHTDDSGRVSLDLPAGTQFLSINSNAYELPAFLGDRWLEIRLLPGEINYSTLRLQPIGTDLLGEWDNLARFVSDTLSSGEPPSQAYEKIREFSQRFRTADNQLDPTLLLEAYMLAAEVSTELHHHEDAEKWRR